MQQFIYELLNRPTYDIDRFIENKIVIREYKTLKICNLFFIDKWR